VKNPFGILNPGTKKSLSLLSVFLWNVYYLAVILLAHMIWLILRLLISCCNCEDWLFNFDSYWENAAKIRKVLCLIWAYKRASCTSNSKREKKLKYKGFSTVNLSELLYTLYLANLGFFYTVSVVSIFYFYRYRKGEIYI
jgi:hypothetical protein